MDKLSFRKPCSPRISCCAKDLGRSSLSEMRVQKDLHLVRCFGQFVVSQILTCAMPDVEYPNHPAPFIHLIEDSPDTALFAKNQAPDFPFCRVSFAGEGTAAGHVFKRVEAIHPSVRRTTRVHEVEHDQLPTRKCARRRLSRRQRERPAKRCFALNSVSKSLRGVTRPASTSARPRLMPSRASSSSMRSSSF